MKVISASRGITISQGRNEQTGSEFFVTQIDIAGGAEYSYFEPGKNISIVAVVGPAGIYARLEGLGVSVSTDGHSDIDTALQALSDECVSRDIAKAARWNPPQILGI
jgi:hypothetical protein